MTDFQEFLSRIPEPLREEVGVSVPLRGLTTLAIGGPAAGLVPVRTTEQARRFQSLCAETGIPCYVLGAGSNVLAADDGFDGLVLKVAADAVEVRGDVLRAGAGISFDRLIERSLAEGMTGLEFASGIPGTLGGAVVGNAGCYGHEIGEFLREAVVLRPDGRLETIGPEDFGFRYRVTDLRGSGSVLLEVTLQLGRGDVHRAAEVRAERIADRRAKHPVDLPSAGSWFRNLEPDRPGGRRQPAGALLEEAGAKEMREGDAAVFARHANIIVNAGRATSADVCRLVERMRAAVRSRFGVELQEEVQRLGRF